jgi:glycosyltransferase involved in cell wall biosynthesis
MVNLVHFYDRPGGIEVLLPVIIREMKQRDFSVFVIRPPSGTTGSVYAGSQKEVTYGSRSNLGALVKLVRYAKTRRDEIFHVFNLGPLYLLMLRLSGVKKVVYSIHGTVYWKKRTEALVIRLLWRLAIDRANYIFTSNSEYSGDLFSKLIAQGIECRLLYNFIDHARFIEKTGDSGSRDIRKIIYAGRLAPEKGLHRWIKTAVAIHMVIPEVSFEIYGEGRLKQELAKRIDDSGASEYITIMGHSNTIDAVYRDADLMLFLSERESFGNVVVESIMCGTPVIVSGIPSMREIFRDFPGFIVEADNGLEGNVIRKLREPDRLRELTHAARIQFSERFSLANHIKVLNGIYIKADGGKEQDTGSLLS